MAKLEAVCTTGKQGGTAAVENSTNAPNKMTKWNCHMITAFEHLSKRIKIWILNTYLVMFTAYSQGQEVGITYMPISR